MGQQDKTTYRIGDVASLTGVEPHVLRFWETEFPTLRPQKTPSGQRLYSPRDLDTIRLIRRLLYEDGFTIAGARKQLEKHNGAPPAEAAPAAPPNGAISPEQLQPIRDELAALLTLLSRR